MESLVGTLDRIQALAAADLRQKSIFELFASAAEELGELSRELLIEEKTFGNTYKQGDEGNRAEAVDLAICALAIYYGRGGSHVELDQLLKRKIDKWDGKHGGITSPSR